MAVRRGIGCSFCGFIQCELRRVGDMKCFEIMSLWFYAFIRVRFLNFREEMGGRG